MGKPLLHLIPGQEALLREKLGNSRADTDSNGLEIVLGKGDDIQRSSTNRSDGSNKTSKSGSSSESGVCSFVHSNASSSSSNSSNRVSKAMNTTLANGPSVIPGSITTSSEIPESSLSKVKVAIQNYEESIEITRQKSIVASADSSLDGRKPSSILSTISRSLTQKTNGGSTRASKKSKEIFKGSISETPFAGISLKSKGNSKSSKSNIEIDIPTYKNGTSDIQIKGAQKFGDESTITSALTFHSSSFGSSYVSNTNDDPVFTPRFEVLLDEIQEADTETEPAEAEAKTESSEGASRINYPSPAEIHGVISRIEVLLDETSEAEDKPTTASVSTREEVQDTATTTKQSKTESSSTRGSPASTSVNPRLFVSPRNQRSTKNRGRRQRQLSSTTRSAATANDPSTTSNLFFSAIDKHVDTKRHGVPKLVQKNDSIEMIQSSKFDNATAASDLDLNSLLSPSKTKGYRRSPTPIDSNFRMPPSPKAMFLPTKMKKVYSIAGGKLVVDLVDECEEHEAIELTKNGSLLFQQQPYHEPEQQKELENSTNSLYTLDAVGEEILEKQFQLLTLEKANDSKSSLKSTTKTKTPSKPLLSKGFRRKNRRLKDVSPQTSLYKKPIKVVVSDDNTGAVELLRTRTSIDRTHTYSSHETDEDSVIKQLSPAQSPVPKAKNQESIGDNDDFVTVVPSSSQESLSCAETIRTPAYDSTERIVSIRKINSKEESFGSPPSIPPLKSPSIAVSSLNNKFKPVIEIHSNRVEEISADVTRAESHSARSIASTRTNSAISPPRKNSPGRTTSGGHETIAASRTEANVPKNGDKLVFSSLESSNPKITKVIPKIPASKKDTTCKSASNQTSELKKDVNCKSENTPKSVVKEAGETSCDSMDTDQLSSKENSRKVKIQVFGVQKADESIKNIEISSVASSGSEDETSGNVSALVKKYTKMVVKRTVPAQESDVGQSLGKTDATETRHVVHVNILGIAGIVVDRKKCRDVTRDDRSSYPPDQMTAVVGISEYGGKSIDNVTTFSSALAHAPNTKSRDDVKLQMTTQRHIAVWASNDKGETPGSVIKSKILNLNATTGKKSRSKFLDLNVALVKSDEGKHHPAVVIGTARIKITQGMMNGTYTKTMDLPVHQVLHEEPLSSKNKNCVLLLRQNSNQSNDQQNLRVEVTSDEDENSSIKNLTSAYTIDPEGDSMIRIQVHVEEVPANSKDKSSFENRTAATERSEESSVCSRETPEQPNSTELYSKPLELPPNFGNDDSTLHKTNWKIDDEIDDPGCRVFGKRVGIPTCTSKSKKGLAGRIDDRIGDMAERVFSKTCRAEDDSSFVLRDTNTFGSDNGHTNSSYPTLLEDLKSALRPIPTLNELHSLAKDFALTGGDYLFARNHLMKNREALVGEDINDSSCVGSATLAGYERELRASGDYQSIESWKKKREDDNVTYSSDDSTSDSLSLNRTAFGEDDVRLNFDRKRRVVSENNRFDIDMGNHREAQSRTRSLESHRLSVSNFDVGCEGDDEESTAQQADKAALIDDTVEQDEKDIKLKRESSGKPSSLPSVVENIAEVLSIGGKACGYFSASKVDTTGSSRIAIWRMQSAASEGQIPKTVDNHDVQSVGELTAITLERNEIKEKNRKLLMDRLGLPKDILAWGEKGKTSTGKDSGMRNADNNSAGVSRQPENYFAEYEEGNNGVRSIYGGRSGDVTTQEKEDSHTDISANESAKTDHDLNKRKIPKIRSV